MIGTSRNNPALLAPAGTKHKVGGGAQIHTALVNLQNPGIALDDNHNLGGSQILNRTLGAGNRYF
jgi:hypothetical protein